jgi:hypothetical protein
MYATRLARATLIPTQFHSTCPCCRQPTPEDLAHLIATCPAWSLQRATLLNALPQPMRSLPAPELATLLIGGSTPSHASIPKWASNGYMDTVRFLSSIIPERRAHIGPLQTPRHPAAPTHTAPTATRQTQLATPTTADPHAAPAPAVTAASTPATTAASTPATTAAPDIALEHATKDQPQPTHDAQQATPSRP